MAYDVFLVSADEDRDMAKLIARRLRALKFKVRFSQKDEGSTFDAKDARDTANSQSMLVLWSADAVKSDWVRAAASIGHSRPGMLVETSLDKTVPYEPFKSGKRFSLEGMTSRKTPEGFYKTVEELGRRDGRTDLREWMNFKSKEDDKRDAWLSDHPTDPLALDTEAKRKKALGIKPAPAAAAAGAAALAAASIGKGGPAASTGAASLGAGSTASSSAASLGSTTAPATAAAAPKAAATAAASYDHEDPGIGLGTILACLAGIGAMLLLGYIYKSQPIPGNMVRGPAIANATFGTCPTGQVPASLVKVLETGPIVDDTKGE